MESNLENSKTFKRWQQFREQDRYQVERKQAKGSTGRAIALLRKSRLFRGKSIINNNRTLDLTLTLSLSLSLFSLLLPPPLNRIHPLSPSPFLLRSTTTPSLSLSPHPIAFQGRSSRETEVKTRNKGCELHS